MPIMNDRWEYYLRGIDRVLHEELENIEDWHRQVIYESFISGYCIGINEIAKKLKNGATEAEIFTFAQEVNRDMDIFINGGEK